MHFTYATAACPGCKQILFLKITSVLWLIRVTSGLGPNLIVCSNCGAEMPTDTREWQQMSLAQKLWYLALSVAYGVVLGFMSSVLVSLAIEKLMGPSPAADDMPGAFVILPITLIVFAVQILRILRSVERSESAEGSRKRAGFWDWETNLQVYGMLWILIVVAGFIPFLL